MIDMEKVINGLKFCIEPGLCKVNCPYYEFHSCVVALETDALALLNAKQPRVMALDEAQKEQYVFLETRKWVDGDYCGTAKHKNTEFSDCITEFLDGYGCVLCCDNAMYGDNWRCWTSRPTDAQREATLWEG